MDRNGTSSEISLLPSKSKRPSIRKQIGSSLSPQLIVLVFTKQPYAERYLANIFSPVFLELLESSSSASKYVPKSFRKFTKKTPVAKFYVSKVAGFYRCSHRMPSVKRCS